MRSLLVLLALTTPAWADYDLSTDECAQPDAHCLPETDPDDAQLDALEQAAAVPDEVHWTQAATPVIETTVSGGCAATTPALLVGILLFAALRKRRWLLAGIAASCTAQVASWDDLVDSEDPAAIDVYAAELGDGDGSQFLLAGQPLEPGTLQPTAAFSLAASGTTPVYALDHRLSTDAAPGAQLLGWATPDGAELVELRKDSGYVYETDPDAIADRVADGYAITNRVATVQPPGLADPPAAFAPAICAPDQHSAFTLLYASPGADESTQLLAGCPGEVVIGEKNEDGPGGPMRAAANHAIGGRTAFVLDRNGDKLRELLMRTNGVERTVAYLTHKLALGYDYIVIDEITSAADWADGTTLNHRLRQLMLRMPIRTVVPYVSIDLTEYPPGAAQMRARRFLLRSFKLRARAIAMEVYLHTATVEAGGAPAAFRRAADRLALAVSGMAKGGGINLRAITTIGTSMHSQYPQYRYLDAPAHDLDALTREANAIRHASARTRQQHGVGYYFVGKSDMAPSSHYTYAQLIARMHAEMLKFK